MKDHSLKALNRRRVLNFGSLSALSLVALGVTRLPRHTAQGRGENLLQSGDAKPALLAFMGALFGRELAAGDVEDLTDRLAYAFSRSESFAEECRLLARFLDKLSHERSVPGFQHGNAAQKDAIIDELMQIDASSVVARFLSYATQSERDYYRMRSSTVGRLAWIYRHSSAVWRARGYRRWPGIGGDWREVLKPGSPYP